MTVLRDAANILDISEYDVMHQAYQHWYGKPAPCAQLDRAFSDYLNTQQPPHWMRHYAIQVIATYEAEMQAQCKCLGLLWLMLWHFKARPADRNIVLIA